MILFAGSRKGEVAYGIDLSWYWVQPAFVEVDFHCKNGWYFISTRTIVHDIRLFARPLCIDAELSFTWKSLLSGDSKTSYLFAFLWILEPCTVKQPPQRSRVHCRSDFEFNRAPYWYHVVFFVLLGSITEPCTMKQPHPTQPSTLKQFPWTLCEGPETSWRRSENSKLNYCDIVNINIELWFHKYWVD